MTFRTRVDRLTAWRQAEAETFTRELEARLAAAVPTLDADAAAVLVSEWCHRDPGLEQRWFSAYRVLGVIDADGRLAGGAS